MVMMVMTDRTVVDHWDRSLDLARPVALPSYMVS